MVFLNQVKEHADVLRGFREAGRGGGIKICWAVSMYQLQKK